MADTICWEDGVRLAHAQQTANHTSVYKPLALSLMLHLAHCYSAKWYGGSDPDN